MKHRFCKQLPVCHTCALRLVAEFVAEGWVEWRASEYGPTFAPTAAGRTEFSLLTGCNGRQAATRPLRRTRPRLGSRGPKGAPA